MDQKIEFDFSGILDCIHCGLCLPKCPSYVILGTETDSPRGRIFLMKSFSEGAVEVNKVFKKHFDLCLGCRGCETACPSGVKYHRLFEEVQKVIKENIEPPLISRFLKRIILYHIFPFPGRLRFVFTILRFYQKSGLQKMVRSSGILKIFSKKLDLSERFMPDVTSFRVQKFDVKSEEQGGNSRKKVGMLRGCVMDYIAPETNRSTVRLLQKCGYDVRAPDNLHCCGAIHQHNGENKMAKMLARNTIDSFDGEGVTTILSNAAGCGAMMKEYGSLLSGDPAYSEKAVRFSAMVKDITEFLNENLSQLSFKPVNRSVVYDEPCHLIHGQGISNEPARLLSSIPGLEIFKLNESEMCCGSAGTFNIAQPELSLEVLKRKMENIKNSGADTVITANVGCMIQLKRGAQMSGCELKVEHIVDILDESVE